MVIRHERGTGHEALERTITALAEKQVKVGYFPHSTYPDGTPVAGVAVVQEHGSVARGIPPRPTFGPTIAEGRQMQRDAIAAAVRRAVDGTQTVDQGLDQLGMAIVGEIKQAIAALTSPPLKAATIERKGSSKPLIGEFGFLLQEVTHVVEYK